MQILDHESDIARAQAKFSTKVRSQAEGTIHVTIGFQSGSTEARVHWLSSLGIWAFFGEPPNGKSPGDRYWNIFGVGKPSGAVSIVCEINLPKHGLDRRVGGAFAGSADPPTFIVHRGNFNARGRIPLSFTRANLRWRWELVQDGLLQTEVLTIDSIDSPSLLLRLRDFILEVQRFKESARDRPWIK